MSRKKSGNRGEVALKLDISKDYDRVNWSFLRKWLRVMGFCERWTDWMMLYVKTVTYNFCINGIFAAKEELAKGFRWVLGNGNDIIAIRDPWLRSNNNFLLERNLRYEQRNEVVSNMFIQN
ncbi:hypothetical protein AgCh_010409 [Apium graveolens]